MSDSTKTYSSMRFRDSTLSSLRKRVLLLIAASTMVVAISFGASFYFAFISSGSSISSQIPELEPVVSKMKSLLMVNTFGLIAVIVASIFVLNRITVWRIFEPLEKIQKSILEVSGGNLPSHDLKESGASFRMTTSALSRMLSSLREREKNEIGHLNDCLDHIEAGRKFKAAQIVENLISEKTGYLEGSKGGVKAGKKDGKETPREMISQNAQ